MFQSYTLTQKSCSFTLFTFWKLMVFIDKQQWMISVRLLPCRCSNIVTTLFVCFLEKANGKAREKKVKIQHFNDKWHWTWELPAHPWNCLKLWAISCWFDFFIIIIIFKSKQPENNVKNPLPLKHFFPGCFLYQSTFTSFPKPISLSLLSKCYKTLSQLSCSSTSSFMPLYSHHKDSIP